MKREELTRLTVDLPKDIHRRLKAIASLRGQTMREVIIEMLCEFEAHEPNKETIAAIEASRDKDKLIRAKSAKDLLNKLGI